MITSTIVLALIASPLQASERQHPQDETATLRKPQLVRVDDEPIDVEVGHAAPLMRDWDGDGTQDLLVGQFGKGYLRVYPNSVKVGAPKLGEHRWGKSEKARLKVPTG